MMKTARLETVADGDNEEEKKRKKKKKMRHPCPFRSSKRQRGWEPKQKKSGNPVQPCSDPVRFASKGTTLPRVVLVSRHSSPGGLTFTMETRALGSTGLRLSCVGFGASPLGNVFGDVSRDTAIATVRRALDLGINFFDTSPYYGATVSESVLGECLRAVGARREDIVISTKCGRYKEGFDFSAERVTRSVDESLARLGVEYVDLIQCHDIEFGSLDQIVNETIPALLKIKESGKARFIGITGLPLDIYTYVLDRVPSGSVDVILSYCHYSINDTSLVGLLPYLKEKGIGIISASPLAMGLLTEGGPPAWHPASEELKSACRLAADHCKNKGKNISKIALQYSLMNKEISTILVGMNSPNQVEENVAAALELSSTGIDEELLQEVQDILLPVKDQTWPSGIQK